MFIGFIDDTELQITTKSNQPDIYVFGGFFIDQVRMPELQQRIAAIKAKYGLQPWHPIKWNLKDLKKYYSDAEAIYSRLMEASDTIRKEALGVLAEFEAIVLACGMTRFADTTPNVDCYRWAFENLLQRIGLMANGRRAGKRGKTNIMVVVDWPQGGIDKSLFDIYAAGYHHGRAVDSGQDYFSGQLCSLNFADSLFYSSTVHCGPLQLADITVGCIKDFLSWCYKKQNRDRVRDRVAAFFPLIVDSLHRGTDGRVTGCGLKVTDKVDLDAKIHELMQAASSRFEQQRPEEIPF